MTHAFPKVVINLDDDVDVEILQYTSDLFSKTRPIKRPTAARHHIPSQHLSALFSSPIRLSNLGTISTPIEIGDDEDGLSEQTSEPQIVNAMNGFKNSVEVMNHISRSQSGQSGIRLDDEDLVDDNAALARSMRRIRTESDVLVDVEEIEGLEEPEDSLKSVGCSERDPELLDKLKSRESRARRSQDFGGPFLSIKEVDLGKIILRVGDTAELQDGDFFQTRLILRNPDTNVSKLRGHRIQRVRYLNGMLSKKLNELCFFYEIDLDDESYTKSQGATEIDSKQVLRVRCLHTTNMPFPLDRTLAVQRFTTMAEASEKGGLTARWKYTCKYSTASERLRNNPQERVLEHIRASECSSPSISDSTRRYHWRGETIRGGSHQPVEGSRKQCSHWNDQRRSNFMFNGNWIKDSRNTTACCAGSPNSEACVDKATKSPSKHVSRSCMFNNRRSAKRMRRQYDYEGQGGFQAFPAIHLNQSTSFTSVETIDLTGSMPLFLDRTIDLTSSELCSPPPSGSLVTTSSQASIRRSQGQKLTYGDAFCGAGGATRGAVLAGLKVEWGFDFWAESCKTWTANFPAARNYAMFADAFIQEARNAKSSGNPGLMKVDILHLSPPCQYFSTAHTVDGINDEMNTASLFAVEATIEVAKPRIVTLEQTFGIALGKFRYYLNALIMMFTSHGFSVRWSIVQLADWGVPQRRKRLIIIASCPGEILPKMPDATHNEHGTNGLKPYSTVNQALRSIPLDAPDHNPASVIPRSNRPWNGDGILPRTMTTSGGQNYHPSGTRDFTNREFATLQGFPVNHLFRGTGVKKQIGNAVPPCVAKVLFESIKRDLDEADGILKETERDDVVVID